MITLSYAGQIPSAAVSPDPNVPLGGGQAEQVDVNIPLLDVRGRGLADAKQLLQSFTVRKWQKKETSWDFLGWPLKRAALMKRRVLSESHMSTPHGSHHLLRFAAVNPGDVKHVQRLLFGKRGELLLKTSIVLGHYGVVLLALSEFMPVLLQEWPSISRAAAMRAPDVPASPSWLGLRDGWCLCIFIGW